MKKFILGVALVLTASSLISAQVDETILEARRLRAELVKEQRAERAAQEQVQKLGRTTAPTSASLTDAEVGESSSFNKNAKFFGTITAGVVIVAPSCDPTVIGFELGPDDRCLVVTDPATTTTANFTDIGRITLPAKQADNIVYLIGNNTTSFVFQNLTGANVSALAGYVPSITIESEALNDPAAIDPNTGLPMAGSYTTTNMGTKSITRGLTTSIPEVETFSYSRANTNGLSRTFWAALGLPTHVIDNLYKKPMTIKLNVRVSVRHIQDATILFSARLLAN